MCCKFNLGCCDIVGIVIARHAHLSRKKFSIEILPFIRNIGLFIYLEAFVTAYKDKMV